LELWRVRAVPERADLCLITYSDMRAADPYESHEFYLIGIEQHVSIAVICHPFLQFSVN
jgi:hypothetical protein